MTDEQIREIAAKAAKSPEGRQMVISAIHLLEAAGFVVTHPDAEISQAVMEAGYRKYGQALYGRPQGWGEAAIAIYHSMLTALSQEKGR